MSENKIDMTTVVNPHEAEWTVTRKKIVSMYNQLLTDEAIRAEFDMGDLSDMIVHLRIAKDRLYDKIHYWYFRQNNRQWLPDYETVYAILKRLVEHGIVQIDDVGRLEGLKESRSKFLAREFLDGVDLRERYPDEFMVLIWHAYNSDFLSEIENLRQIEYERLGENL